MEEHKGGGSSTPLPQDDYDGPHFSICAVLSGHGKDVRCLTIFDNLLFSGSRDNTVKAWDPQAMQ
ncbi:unnamed protein product, partial [Phaeothamnion confervicola]